MHSTTSFITAVLGAAPILSVSASTIPLNKRQQVCAGTQVPAFYINPQPEPSCTSPQTVFPPAAGPPPGNTFGCTALDPNRGTFVAANVNIPCSDYPFDIQLFSTPDCSDEEPVTFSGPDSRCLQANVDAPFVAFKAAPSS
ncbi:MAG: hypothetical protein M1831_000310 [Alyxoria varia]|nr:MAG: hypothetical protein M1831_000310 [Alyxoria varia]